MLAGNAQALGHLEAQQVVLFGAGDALAEHVERAAGVADLVAEHSG